MKLVLASASPARLATLRSAGIEPLVRVSGVDESLTTNLAPGDLAMALAQQKCAAVAAIAELPLAALVLGCDSVLEFAGQAYGKPADTAEAIDRWKLLRGQVGVLHTGHALIDRSTGQQASASGATEVHFADVSDWEIAKYVATGEPLQVAGAFTVDGLGGAFITKISGDYHNVVGLSLPLLRDLVAKLGHSYVELWSGPLAP